MTLNGSPRGPNTGVQFRARCAAGGVSGELFGGCLPAEGPAGSGVEFGGDRSDLLGGVDAQIGALGKILPQQPVGRSYVCQAAAGASMGIVFGGRVAA